MTSLRLTYTLLKQYFKFPHICNNVTVCNNGSYTPPHLDTIGLPEASRFLLIFFQNFLISLFYVFCLDNIFFIANNKRLNISHKHACKTENHWNFFTSKTKIFFHCVQTNTFLVATRAVSNNYSPWWQQTKTSRR
jgi:hypothetical protein